MKLTEFTSEKENYRKEILEKAKKLDPKLITKKNIRNNPNFLATEDHIQRLFGGITKLKEVLNIKGHYKTDKEVIIAVKRISSELGRTYITRLEYIKNKTENEPSTAAQYTFMKYKKIQKYKDFISYCVNFKKEFNNKYTYEKVTDENKDLNNKIRTLLGKGLYDKNIALLLNISASSVKRYRVKNNIQNNHKKDIDDLRKG